MHQGDHLWLWGVAWQWPKLYCKYPENNFYQERFFIQVVDTPGFGDSDNDDEILIEEMMDTLANVVDHADTIVLLLDGRKTRFDASLQNMLKRMTQIFGLDWWNYVVIGVNFWPYDQDSIDDRECYPDYPERCHDEAWFCGETNSQLQEKFNLKKTFTCVFTD